MAAGAVPDRAPTDGPRGDDAPAYPAWWEADVVLYDGTTTHLRPIRPDDGEALQAFHTGQSELSIYLRFFAPLARLPEAELVRLTHVDHVDRVAFVAVTGGVGAERIVAVGRYDRVDEDSAEVAFTVADALHGKGLGSMLLEHLAAAARERGVRRFVADVLPQNSRMIAVFRDAGYEVQQRTEDGVVTVAFGIDPTDRSLAVMAAREHRAEAVSMRGLLTARSVVVVGPGRGDRTRAALHGAMVRRVVGALVTDPGVVVHTVGVEDVPHDALVHDDLAEVPGPLDLAVVAVDPARAVVVVRALARLQVRGVVLMSAGFAEDGPDGVIRQRALLRAAHGAGMRVVGPGSFGLLSTHEGVTLNASLADPAPAAGRAGLFCQSAPMAVTLLAAAGRRGLPIAQLVSAGHRADVSGNDLMQFWGEDPDTRAVALYLESIGNPRKFSRVARRLAAVKPVVVVTAGRSGQVVPPGHAVRPTQAPVGAMREILRRSGVLQVDNTHQLMDALQLFALQPLPAGPRTAILASSASIAALVGEAAAAAGLDVPGDVALVPEDAPADQLRAAIDAVYAADVDAVLVVRVPLLGGLDLDLTAHLARAAARTGRTTVACIPDLLGVSEALTAPDDAGQPCTVPAFASPEDAAAALGLAARYSAWRAADRGRPVRPAGVDTRAARRLVHGWLEGAGEGTVVLSDSQVAELLACVGVEPWANLPVRDAAGAVAAAAALGGPVALKSTLPGLRHRADLGGVRLDLVDPDEIVAAALEILALGRHAATGDEPSLVVQAMAPRGVACVLRTVEDPLFGPVVSFGVSGDAVELLGDVAYGVPPFTDVDVQELVRTARAAPKLLGHRGAPPLDVAALEDLVARLAMLADDLPELRSLELNPVVVAERGVFPLAVRATVAPAERADAARRLLPRS
ncbi:MAG: GNAT family N-acetyltransferase [Actinobacteria bacterium]|nr:GNAT family N-acetyltransferase [Actinomycetota bacterium]MCG2800412.1 GNAT family N-acetyltransferase [Cellulomonas sp.]